MKHIFIVNPISGAGRGKKIGENIERVAPELGLDYEVHYTTRGHEATEIAKKYNFTTSEAVNYCNKKSGVLGVSGVSSDFRDIRAAADQGNHRAQIALDIFAYSVKKYVGSYTAALGGIDCLVFTAGVGENVSLIRSKVCESLGYLGIEIDEAKNNEGNNGQIRDLSKEGSKVKVLVIPTNEELAIARETARLTK